MDIDEAPAKIQASVDRLTDELKKLRTGRANAKMLENVQVEVYGQNMPLPHVASVTVLDAQMLQIQPFDPNNLEAISAAIRDDQALSLNPADDGKVVRVPIPPMTEERRLEVVKQLKSKVEDTNIVLRNIRHDVLNHAKRQKNDGDISEDELRRIDKQINELMDKTHQQIEELAKNKESEIMTV